MNLRCIHSRDYVRANKPAISYLRIELYTEQSAALKKFQKRIAILIDNTLAKDKLEIAKKSVISAYSLLEKHDYFAVISLSKFATTVIKGNPSGEEKQRFFAKKSPGITRKEFSKKIDKIKTNEGLDLYGGLVGALKDIKFDGEAIKRAIVIIGSELKIDDSGKTNYMKLSDDMKKDGISLVVLSIGKGDETLHAMAKNTNGFLRVIDLPALYQTISEEIARLNAVVAVNNRIQIQKSDGVELKGLFKIRPDVMRLNIGDAIECGDLVIGEPQVYVLQSMLPPRPEGTFRMFRVTAGNIHADCTVNYTKNVKFARGENLYPRIEYMLGEIKTMIKTAKASDDAILNIANDRISVLENDHCLRQYEDLRSELNVIKNELQKIKEGGIKG